MEEPLGIALIGCGTVGSGVAKLLLEHPQRLAARAARKLVLRKVVVRDLHKPREVALPRELLTTDLNDVLHDPQVQVAVELVGGVDWAKETVLKLFSAGKHVVTANKALLAMQGRAVFDAARQHGLAIAFEAAVAGGVPIIAALSESLTANQILSLQGIVNGTCNYILTQMSEQQQSYASALADAQKLGYAEADPTLDVTGYDAAHKLAILAQIAFGANFPVHTIERRGIDQIDSIDIRYAKELGYTIKLLAEAWLSQRPNAKGVPTQQLALHVSPVMLRQNTPLAQVRGAYNAIKVVGDAVGDTLYYGRGAGQVPTASAVVADLIDFAVGRAQRTFQTLRLWSEETGPTGIQRQSAESVPSRFYLRCVVADRPGVMAELTRELAGQEISIASIIQHEALDEHTGEQVPLVIMTHTADTGRFRQALQAIDKLGCVVGPSVYYPVGD